MTTSEMKRRGEAHAKAGKQCTPFDCQEIDREILAASKAQDRPAKFYAKMRGAFNRGWEREYCKQVLES